MAELTSDLVRRFWHHMAARFRAQIVPKASAAEMQIVSELLNRMGIADKDDFMRRFATTIGRRIYLPFAPGDVSPGWGLLSQVETCVHECHHIVQYDSLGPPMFVYQYVVSKARRALLEAQAYRTNLEMRFRLTGQMLDPASLAASLRSYDVSEADVLVATRILAAAVPTIRAGGVMGPACSEAQRWLRSNGGLR